LLVNACPNNQSLNGKDRTIPIPVTPEYLHPQVFTWREQMDFYRGGIRENLLR
jgi:hypothetical protein